MAKQRIINTKFWSDPYIQSLKPDEKLVYLYLLTNERTSICGIYEITENTISFDTGLTVPRLRQIVDSLIHANKLRKEGNWVYLTNFNKHQKNNPSVEQGIERAIKELPEGLSDRLGTDWVQSDLLKPKLELEPEPKPKDIYMFVLEKFNQLTGKNYRMTPEKQKQLKTRFEKFSFEELEQAIKNRLNDPSSMGKNKDGKIWAHDWDSLFRNNENVDRALNLKGTVVVDYQAEMGRIGYFKFKELYGKETADKFIKFSP